MAHSTIYVPIVEFLEEYYQPFGAPPKKTPDLWARILRAAFTPNDQLELPYSTVILSFPKKCMAAGERVWLSDGRYLPVEELVGREVEVWAYEDGHYRTARAEVDPNGQDEVWEIRTKTGRRLKRTGFHPLLTWAGWTPVSDLSVGDHIGLPNAVPEPTDPIPMDPDVVRFLGYMIGDGGLTGKSTPRFTQNPGPLLEDMRGICERLGFRLTPTGPTSRIDYCVTGSSALCRQYGLMGTNSYEKRVPPDIFRLPNEQLWQFLSALIATDGHIIVQETMPQAGTKIGYSTVSRRLADDVMALWARLGHYPILSERPMPNGRRGDTVYQIHFGTSTEIVALAEHLTIPGKEAALQRIVDRSRRRRILRHRHVDTLPKEAWDDLFAAQERSGKGWGEVLPKGRPVRRTWAPTRDRIIALATYFGDDDLVRRASQPVCWDEIVSIERVGLEATYAVAVPGPENYLGAAIDHNCAKTSYGAGICTWFAYCMAETEHGGLIVYVANKKEQAKKLGYQMIFDAIEKHPLLRAATPTRQVNMIKTEDGVRIYPITTEAGGEAGSEPEIIWHDEMWACTEYDERLFAELTPVPTRRNSFRLITSYAGWENTSTILHRLYRQGMQGEPHPDFLDVKGVDGEPCVWVNKEAGMFMAWVTGQGHMPWHHTEKHKKYLQEQEATLPKTEFRRLHYNLWGSGQESIEMEDWDACTMEDYDPQAILSDISESRRIYLAAGADASYRRDLTACMTVFKRDGKFWVGPFMTWNPAAYGKDFDLEKTIEAYLLMLKQRFRLRDVYYDPFQFHRSALTLMRRGLRMKEWTQGPANTKMMGTNLTTLLRERRIVLPPDPFLRHQAKSTVLQFLPEGGVVLKKDKHNQKIDAIIALSMALIAAQDLPDLSADLSKGFLFV